MLAARMKAYRVKPGASRDATTGCVIEIVQFRSEAAAAGGATVAEAITTSLPSFDAEVSAGLVVSGTWTTEDGPAGSIILAQDGLVVAIVTVAGFAETEAAGQALSRLVLDRVRASGLSVGPDQPSAAESSPAADW